MITSFPEMRDKSLLDKSEPSTNEGWFVPSANQEWRGRKNVDRMKKHRAIKMLRRLFYFHHVKTTKAARGSERHADRGFPVCLGLKFVSGRGGGWFSLHGANSHDHRRHREEPNLLSIAEESRLGMKPRHNKRLRRDRWRADTDED